MWALVFQMNNLTLYELQECFTKMWPPSPFQSRENQQWWCHESKSFLSHYKSLLHTQRILTRIFVESQGFIPIRRCHALACISALPHNIYLQTITLSLTIRVHSHWANSHKHLCRLNKCSNLTFRIFTEKCWPKPTLGWELYGAKNISTLLLYGQWD